MIDAQLLYPPTSANGNYGTGVAITPDGNAVLITDQYNGRAYLYLAGVLDHTWDLGQGTIYGCAISDDASVVVLGRVSGGALAYRSSDWTTPVGFPMGSLTNDIVVKIAPDGSRIYVGTATAGAGSEGQVYWYDGVDFVDGHFIEASDKTAGDRFGFSIAISEDLSTLIVGAPTAEAVYVYTGVDYTTEQIITADTPAAGEYFGVSVSISADGGTAVIGAENATVGFNLGRVLVKYQTTTPFDTETQLSPAGFVYLWGRSVVISRDASTILAVSPNVATSYLALFTGANWATEEALTYPPAETQNDLKGFGYGYQIGLDMQVDGADIYVVAGAAFHQLFGRETGIGYLWGTTYDLPDSPPEGVGSIFTGQQPDSSSFDLYGVAIAMNYNKTHLAVIDDKTNPAAHVLYVYINGEHTYSVTLWDGANKIDISDDATKIFVADSDGLSYILSGTGYTTATPITLGGVVLHDMAINGNGDILVFGEQDQVRVRYGVGFASEVILTASDSAGSDDYGRSVDITEAQDIIVGAPDYPNGDKQGHAYVYTGALWVTETILTSITPTNGDAFGQDVAIGSNGGDLFAAVGAPEYPAGAGDGAVFMFYTDTLPFDNSFIIDAPDPNGGFFGNKVVLATGGTLGIIEPDPPGGGRIWYVLPASNWSGDPIEFDITGGEANDNVGNNPTNFVVSDQFVEVTIYAGILNDPDYPNGAVYGFGSVVGQDESNYPPDEEQPPGEGVVSLSFDEEIFPYMPTEIDIVRGQAVESQTVSGAWEATPRPFGAQVRLTWGVDVAVIDVIQALRDVRNGTIVHSLTIIDPSEEEHTFFFNWVSDPPYVEILQSLYQRFSIAFNECQEVPS